MDLVSSSGFQHLQEQPNADNYWSQTLHEDEYCLAFARTIASTILKVYMLWVSWSQVLHFCRDPTKRRLMCTQQRCCSGAFSTQEAADGTQLRASLLTLLGAHRA